MTFPGSKINKSETTGTNGKLTLLMVVVKDTGADR
jgi:hypothetical protein